MDYQPNSGDIEHIFSAVLKASGQLQALSPFADIDADLMRQVLDEAGKFVAKEIAPLHRSGDEIGCTWASGQVTTPPGFAAAYEAFWQAGWPALAVAPEDGGQGLPAILEAILFEMLSGANHGWTMAPGLLHGAYECIRHHGSEGLKSSYLEKVASGEWLATMCLTEPHAGSDLGLVRTRAVSQVDGSFQVSGTKIFISGGEHDLTRNIVHLVLARLPDAAPGPKGLSLFLVPKFLSDDSRNAVHCERIEEKMGLHGSPTCVMRFDEATGWLVGEANRGLQAMFVMMNSARLHVALQGVGLLEAAWQKADAYSRERRQMRVPGPRSNSEPADLIAGHPAMRRILDTQRAWIDGGRVLAYRTAIELDVAKHHADAARRSSAQRWCALVTPVLKASLTQQAFFGASECLQVLGGHGYVREWGIEQVVRDARVAMIYEGTNEIQAIDLLVRKVLVDGGASLASLLHDLTESADQQRNGTAGLLHRINQTGQLTTRLCLACGKDSSLAYWVADDFLRVVTLVLLDWAWLQIEASVPGRSIAAPGAIAQPQATDARWLSPLAALNHWVLPEFDMRLGIIAQRLG